MPEVDQTFIDQYHQFHEENQNLKEWKRVVIDALVVNFGYKKVHEDNPTLALNDLIRIETQMALDPAISREAQELYQEGFEKGHNDEYNGDPYLYGMD